MSLLIRNVTGHDVVTLWEYVDENSPVTEDELLDNFFPEDPTDPEKDDQIKPLEDAIEFLKETSQITESGDGYQIDHEFCDSKYSIELNILRGIRRQHDDTAAYNEILEHLVHDDEITFDRRSGLVDAMSERMPHESWNDTRLRYWVRVMQVIGIVRDINPESGEDATTVISPEKELLFEMFEVAMEETGSRALSDVLDHIHQTYLPVYAQGGRLSAYMDRCLKLYDGAETADGQRALNLGTESDMGEPVGENDYRSIRFS